MIGERLKQARTVAGLTTRELAEKAGVGLRFIRDMEQGKSSLRMDKVNQVLELFGYKLLPEKGVDTFDLLSNYTSHILFPLSQLPSGVKLFRHGLKYSGHSV